MLFKKLSPTDALVLDDRCEIKKSCLKIAKNDSVPDGVFLCCHVEYLRFVITLTRILFMTLIFYGFHGSDIIPQLSQ